MGQAKRLFLRIGLFKRLQEKGYLNRQERRNLLIYYFFRIFFGLHRESPYPLHFTSNIIMPSKLKIGKNVHKSLLVSGNCYYQAINGIEIGDNTIIAPGAKIISANHDFSNFNTHVPSDSIMIGANCWIGANAVILPGVKLADNVIVAAGAVVTKSCLIENSVLVGVPARAITVSK